MGGADFANGVSRETGQEAWMPNSQARIHWLEGWDEAKTMTPKAYYNEHDPKAAAWLRELIKANLIAPGQETSYAKHPEE